MHLKIIKYGHFECPSKISPKVSRLWWADGWKPKVYNHSDLLIVWLLTKISKLVYVEQLLVFLVWGQSVPGIFLSPKCLILRPPNSHVDSNSHPSKFYHMFTCARAVADSNFILGCCLLSEIWIFVFFVLTRDLEIIGQIKNLLNSEDSKSPVCNVHQLFADTCALSGKIFILGSCLLTET
jgi:hypothetical protein